MMKLKLMIPICNCGSIKHFMIGACFDFLNLKKRNVCGSKIIVKSSMGMKHVLLIRTNNGSCLASFGHCQLSTIGSTCRLPVPWVVFSLKSSHFVAWQVIRLSVHHIISRLVRNFKLYTMKSKQLPDFSCINAAVCVLHAFLYYA